MSAHATAAPSRAARIDIALPLPTGASGSSVARVPAPTTSSNRSFRRFIGTRYIRYGRPSVIADLHCHYPMHLLARTLRQARPTTGWCGAAPAAVAGEAARLVFRFAARGFNYRDHASGWRVDLDRLEKGTARLVLSVLYEPFAEIDLDELPQSDPEDGYFADLIDHLDRMEAELASIDPGPAAASGGQVRSGPRRGAASGRVAFVHCVEGGFHLGHTPDARSRERRRAGPPRRRLRDARPPVLSRHRHERAGAADAVGRDLQAALLPARQRADRARRGGRAGDVRAPHPDRPQPHARGCDATTPSTLLAATGPGAAARSPPTIRSSRPTPASGSASRPTCSIRRTIERIVGGTA